MCHDDIPDARQVDATTFFLLLSQIFLCDIYSDHDIKLWLWTSEVLLFSDISAFFSASCLCRDQNAVLAEDREKLRVFQPLQPWFTQEQREELAEVHSWIQQNTIPEEINTQVHVRSSFMLT